MCDMWLLELDESAVSGVNMAELTPEFITSSKLKEVSCKCYKQEGGPLIPCRIVGIGFMKAKG